MFVYFPNFFGPRALSPFTISQESHALPPLGNFIKTRLTLPRRISGLQMGEARPPQSLVDLSPCHSLQTFFRICCLCSGKAPKLLSTFSWLCDSGPVMPPLWYSPVKWEDDACLLYLMGLRHKSCLEHPNTYHPGFHRVPSRWFLNH